mgnify:CR=1 FL=1
MRPKNSAYKQSRQARASAVAVFALAAACLLLSAVPTFSFELESIDLRTGLAWIGNTDTSQGSETSPLVVLPGAGVSFRLSNVVRFAPSVEFHLDEYALVDSGRAVPTQIETGSAVGPIALVGGVMVATPWYFGFFPIPELELAAAVSPTVFFRFPLFGIETSDTTAIGNYLMGQGRFVFPELRLFAGFRRSESVAFTAEARVLFPLFNAWIQEAPSLPDQLIVTGGVGLRIFLPPPQENPEASSEDDGAGEGDTTPDGPTQSLP